MSSPAPQIQALATGGFACVKISTLRPLLQACRELEKKRENFELDMDTAKPIGLQH